jgi:hypothetical protein
MKIEKHGEKMEEWNVIATIYLEDGYEIVGTRWRVETKVFSCNENIKRIFEWAKKQANGRTISTSIELSVA